MSRGTTLIVAVVVLFIGWSRGPAGFILAVLAEAVVYFVSLRLHPRIRHTGLLGLGWFTCRGTGERHSHLFRWIYHNCRRCNGSGRVIRLGARHAGADYVRRSSTTAGTQRAERKRTRTWR